VLLWACAARASDNPATVAISVVDVNNQPIANATVRVTVADTLVTTVTTDPAGRASVELPVFGAYQLHISKKGYLLTDSAIEFIAGRGMPSVDVMLTTVDLSQQSVDVKDTADNPVMADSGAQQNLPTAQAKVSPTRPVTLTDALPLIPGIIRGQDGSVKIAGFGEDQREGG